MANDVRIHVTVTDDASPALRKVGQETDKVGASAALPEDQWPQIADDPSR